MWFFVTEEKNMALDSCVLIDTTLSISSPIKAYLHSRGDTVRCIVTTLTSPDFVSELADELTTGGLVASLLHGNAWEDPKQQDFDSYVIERCRIVF